MQESSNDWNLFVKGDQSMLKKYYEENVDDLYHLGKKYANDPGLVEDCIQDIFLNLWEVKARITEPTSLKAYLFMSLRNKIFDHYRKNKKLITTGKPIEDLNGDESFESNWIMEETSHAQNLKINKAMKNLTPKQSEILFLKYEKGLSYEEISSILGINYQSARNLIHRTIVELRKEIIIVVLLMIKL